MMDTLRLLLSSQLNHSKLTQKTGGFTLIELLVGMILAALVITPLLTFMTSVMNNERREQAKATSEQELQAALDYIAQDLEQAVYIYDADGLTKNNNSTTPDSSGIKNQIPPAAPATGCNNASACQPVLVFWKRENKKNVVPFNTATSTASCPTSSPDDPSPCDDTFVYSLVGYYLIKDDSDDTWSNTARIGRFQIQDGVKGSTGSYIYTTGNNARSSGFEVFNTTLKGNLKVKMNQWKRKEGEVYTTGSLNTVTPQTPVLLDYIDHSTAGVPQVSCPANTQAVPPYPTGPAVPASVDSSAVTNTFKTYSFYACVDSSRTVAQVFLRGNALARIKDGMTYSASNSNYFPQVSIQVQGRGFLEAK